MINFVSEKELFELDPRLPEALMCVAYFENVSVEQMGKAMNIQSSYAKKLIKFLENFGFVKTEKGEKKLTFNQQEYLKAYACSKSALENLFGDGKLKEQDPLLSDVVKFIEETGDCSTMAIRKKFSISYPRAAKMVDYLVEIGIVEPKENTASEQMLKEHEIDFDFDKLKLLDETGKALKASESKHIKTLLHEQFRGIGLICIEQQEAEMFFKRNNYIMHCKTFSKASKQELQAFVDKNKIDSGIFLYEASESASISELAGMFPKLNMAFFAVSLLPLKETKVNILY